MRISAPKNVPSLTYVFLHQKSRSLCDKHTNTKYIYYSILAEFVERNLKWRSTIFPMDVFVRAMEKRASFYRVNFASTLESEPGDIAAGDLMDEINFRWSRSLLFRSKSGHFGSSTATDTNDLEMGSDFVAFQTVSREFPDIRPYYSDTKRILTIAYVYHFVDNTMTLRWVVLKYLNYYIYPSL